jgi:hypothetical protein
MNEITKLIADTLLISEVEASIWQERIEDWDEMDCSEWSEAKMRKHIKSFVNDWTSIYKHLPENAGA